VAKETPRTVKKTTISKKATLQVQHTCFVLFFPVVLHEYNVKLPETSWLKVLWRKCRTCFLFTIFFSLPLIFTLVATSISQFLTAATKFLCCSSNKKRPLSFFTSRSGSLSVFFSLSFTGLSPIFSFSPSFSFSGYIPNLWTRNN